MLADAKIELYVHAWKQGIDDTQMAKCFLTLSTKQQAVAWSRFISSGGSGQGFEANKRHIVEQKKITSIAELREFIDNQDPDTKFGASKVIAKSWNWQKASFAPTMIPVQVLGWSTQVNWVADSYWSNSMCDGDPSDIDWEYAYWFGEPTYAYQFRVWATTAPVMALLAYYGNVIARAPGDGNVIVCLGNAGGSLPDWYVAASMNMYR